MTFLTNHNNRTYLPEKLDTELDLHEYIDQDHFPTLFNDFKTLSFQPLSPQSESSLSCESTSPSDDNTMIDVTVHEIFSNYVQIPNEIENDKIESESLSIKVLGIQSTGAKSRVETQIKLCVQLVTNDGRKVPDWSYIKIKESLLTRSKLKKSNQKQADGSVTTLVSDESEILQLDAKVVCASNPEHSIRSCIGCVRRERKRSERTKEGKLKSEPYQQQDLEAERDRILLFNCNPLINFSSGDAILPTRITCYCRHHNEKQGFKVCFALKNNQGETIATGVSPPIMITDDHKSSKQQNSRKRAREHDLPTNHLETPASSRRGSIIAVEENMSSLIDVHPTPSQTPKSDIDEIFGIQSLTQSNKSLGYSDIVHLDGIQDNNESWPFNQRRKINDQFNDSRSSSISSSSSFSSSSSSSSSSSPTSILGSSVGTVVPGLTSTTASLNIPTLDSVLFNPRLEHIVPSQGPTYGGIEVSILGSGFYEGLTCMFGEHAATTVYWNETTMVCILPPATHTGPVIVSFKEHPLVLEGQDIAFFTYFDASDQALMQLALQVVGMKMTGKLQDAKQVAMQIVQGKQKNNTAFDKQVISTLKNSSFSKQNITIRNSNGHSLLHLAAQLNYTKLAQTLLNICNEKQRLCLLHLQDRYGMTALHFAAQIGSMDMIQLLLESGANTQIKSHFGTASKLIPKYIHKKLNRDALFTLIEPYTQPFSPKSTKTQSDSDEIGIYRQKVSDSYSILWLSTLIGKQPSLSCQELFTHATYLFYKYTVSFGFSFIQANAIKSVKPIIDSLIQKNSL